MDKNKCPKLKIPKYFWEKYLHVLYNKFPKQLKAWIIINSQNNLKPK